VLFIRAGLLNVFCASLLVCSFAGTCHTSAVALHWKSPTNASCEQAMVVSTPQQPGTRRVRAIFCCFSFDFLHCSCPSSLHFSPDDCSNASLRSYTRFVFICGVVFVLRSSNRFAVPRGRRSRFVCCRRLFRSSQAAASVGFLLVGEGPRSAARLCGGQPQTSRSGGHARQAKHTRLSAVCGLWTLLSPPPLAWTSATWHCPALCPCPCGARVQLPVPCRRKPTIAQ
jgi:hypothetical protein